MDATITIPSIHILNGQWPYFHSPLLQLKALSTIIVVFPMTNILAEHRMLDFKALALVRGTLSKSFTYKLTPFPAYILDPSDIERRGHKEHLTMKERLADWAARHELNFIVGSSSRMSPHTTHRHPSPQVSTPPLPSLPPLPSFGHPPSTAHPSPATTCSLHTAHIAKIHPARWRRDNSNPSGCNPLNHHLPYPYNHLKRTAMVTCHRRATSSGSLSSAFLFTYRLLGLFSVYHRMLEDHSFSHVVSWAPVEISLS